MSRDIPIKRNILDKLMDFWTFSRWNHLELTELLKQIKPFDTTFEKKDHLGKSV